MDRKRGGKKEIYAVYLMLLALNEQHFSVCTFDFSAKEKKRKTKKSVVLL